MNSEATLTRASARAVRKRSIAGRIFDHKLLYLMLVPALACLIVTRYGPMFGLYMAFIDYFPDGKPFFSSFFTSQFVGLKWFESFFQSGDFLLILRNTMATSLLSLLISFPAPIILALALNEVKNGWFKKSIQTVSYLPHFISWVIVANIFMTLLSSEGVVNQVLKALNLTTDGVFFFQEGRYFWWIVAVANTWKSMGYNSIMYLAAISGISQEQYESAKVDGAGRMKQIIHITLPALKPTIVMLFIFAISGILNAGFDQQMLMQNDMIRDYSDVIDTYAYRYGLRNSMFAYGAAVGLFKSCVSFVLLLTANFLAKKYNEQSLF